VLSHKNRKDRIHVITPDQALADDICERLRDDSQLTGVEVIAARVGNDLRSAVVKIDAMAADTVASRLLIIDVRRYMLPRLQQAYNKVLGYNRRDLNGLCHILLIGDGPERLLDPGTRVDIFAPLLAKHRLDYLPAAYFYDPFLHYTHQELQEFRLGLSGDLPAAVPRRLADSFTGDSLIMNGVRRYFRAAGLPAARKPAVKRRRQEKLAKLFRKRMDDVFPLDKDDIGRWLTYEGYRMGGEILSLHFYPLYFEQWCADLMEKARQKAK